MSDVSFNLPDESLEEYTWVLADEHAPTASPPLTVSLFGGQPARPEEDGVPRSLRLNGFTYTRRGAGPGQGPLAGDRALPASVEEMRRWRDELQPQVDQVVDMLTSFDATTVEAGPGRWREALDAHNAEVMGVFGPVHREAVLPAHAIGGRFRELYVERFGEDRLADAVALLQGMPNASLERAAMLWQLSRLLRAEPGLAEAVERGERLDSPDGRAFAAGLDELRERFGATSETFVEDQPNWGESPAMPLAAVRAYAGQPDGQGPLDSAARQRERREQLEMELARAVASGDEQAIELARILPVAQELMPNLEDHNYHTDQRLTAASRARWLAIGRHLQSLGLATAVDDVFYFTRDELIETLEGGAAVDGATLQARRAELALWRSVSPPPVLGKPLEPDAPPLPADLAARVSEVRVVRGIAASTGSYRGRARVIESLRDAETLRPGDVLVTRATTPAWTPFFGVVSALVVNTGGLLSHASVVAREFGLPAVVGTTNGTAQIPDGATITVDGANGLVLIEG